MNKAELEEKVKRLEAEVEILRIRDGQRTAEGEKADVWLSEVLRILHRRGIDDCTDVLWI